MHGVFSKLASLVLIDGAKVVRYEDCVRVHNVWVLYARFMTLVAYPYSNSTAEELITAESLVSNCGIVNSLYVPPRRRAKYLQ